MRKQISNDLTKTWQGSVFFVGLAIVFVVAFYFFDKFSKDFTLLSFLLTALGIICSIALWYYVSVARFYTVEFDDISIYFSRFQTKGQIDLARIVKVKPSIFPQQMFYRNVYTVVVEYLDKENAIKKIRFLSKARSNVGTIDDIPFLDTLKQLVKENKSKT
jgi:hypothetical protein